METITKYLSDDLLYSAGWTIFHSIWIGALISILLLIVLNLLNKRSARIRYNVSLAALSIFASIVCFIFVRTMESAGGQSLNSMPVTSLLTESSTPLLLNTTGGLENIDLKNDVIQSIILFLNNNYSLISILWLIGMIFMITRFTGGLVYSAKLRKSGRANENNIYTSISRTLKKKIGIERAVIIMESIIARVPMTTGWLKPVIYIPIGALAGIPYNQVEAIIAHELAHIKRNDYLVNIFQSLIEIVMFYHPAVWWMSSLIRSEREIACDDIAIELSDEKLTYIKALMSISEIDTENVPAAVAFAGDTRNLLYRIKRITKMTHPKLNRTDKWTSALMGIILIAGILLVSGFRTEPGIDESEIPLSNISESIISPYNSAVQYITDKQQDPNKISGTIDRTIIDPTDNKEKEATFTFKDGELTKLVVDGIVVPESDYHLYDDIIVEVKDDLADVIADMEEALIDLEDAMEEIEEINMEEIELEIQEAIKEIEEIDLEAMELEIEDALREIEEIDMEEIEIEMQETLTEIEESLEEIEEIDMKNIEFEIQKALKEIEEMDIEKIKAEMMESLKGVEELDLKEIMKEMEKSMEEIRESLKDINIDQRMVIENHKRSIEGQKKELEKQLIEMQEQQKQQKQNADTTNKKKKEKIS